MEHVFLMENQIQENGSTKCANIKLGWKISSMDLS
jgi:hypothetical protein